MDLDELVFHPWTVQGSRDVPTFVGGSGNHVIDADGRSYLDFSSQFLDEREPRNQHHGPNTGPVRRSCI